MKPYLLAILTLTLLTGFFAACGAEIDTSERDEKISVVATIFAPYDFAREVVGDRADVTMLLPPGAESHSFEPTPRDIIKIQSCDVFIYVGGESDAWVEELLSSVDRERVTVVTLMDCVEALPEEAVPGMDTGHDHDHEAEVELDEHVWTSPKNAALIVEKITDALCAADENGAGTYRSLSAAYIEKLDGLDAAFREVVSAAPQKTLVFGDRFPFRYFAEEYGLEYFAAFPGCSSETEPSAKTMAFLIDKLREESIPVVFYIELSNRKIADAISEATGAKPLLLHSCHNISRDDFLSGVGYLDLMGANLTNLKEALG